MKKEKDDRRRKGVVEERGRRGSGEICKGAGKNQRDKKRLGRRGGVTTLKGRNGREQEEMGKFPRRNKTNRKENRFPLFAKSDSADLWEGGGGAGSVYRRDGSLKNRRVRSKTMVK